MAKLVFLSRIFFLFPLAVSFPLSGHHHPWISWISSPSSTTKKNSRISRLFLESTSTSSSSISSHKNQDKNNEDQDDDVVVIACQFLESFQEAWSMASDKDNDNDDESIKNTLLDLFMEEDDTDNNKMIGPFWRDMIAFTWNIGTHEGSSSIQAAFDQIDPSLRQSSTWDLSHHPLPPSSSLSPSGQHQVEFWCDLKVGNIGTGKAHFRLIQLQQQPPTPTSTTCDNDNNYKIVSLLTTLLELKDRPFQVGSNRIRGHIHGPIPQRQYWKERLHHDKKDVLDDDYDTYVAIIGGGQAGLALGARLQLLGIPYQIFEAGYQPGMAWRKRYPSLHLHDPVWYNHMPYLPFPESWPIFCPRDKIADWMDAYAQVMDLNIQTRSRITAVRQSSSPSPTTTGSTSWELQVQHTSAHGENSIDQEGRPSTATSATKNNNVRSDPQSKKMNAKATTTSIRAKHVVFATGNSSHARIPKFPGRFGGIQLHSSKYCGGRDFANKRVVVIGSNNSAFDIVQDLWEQGVEHVTMIQRSPSLVVSTESILNQGLGGLYRQDAPLHHEDADLVATASPYKMLLPRWRQVTKQMKENDAELHQGLVDADYQLDFGPDDTGVFAKSATEGGGFYINMGCAELLIRGDVSIRYATVSHLDDDAVIIRHQKDKDKQERLPADVIIYATGYDTMDQWVAELCGEEVAESIGRTWGLGYGKRPHKDPGPWEGEIRNMWKPTTVEGLWFHGGNLAQSRHYSRFLALQLAARYMGVKTPVWGIPKPTPTSKTPS